MYKLFEFSKKCNEAHILDTANTTRHYGRKPAPFIYYLQNLQGKFCGAHFLTSPLRLFRELVSFTFAETIFQIFGPKLDMISEP